MEKKLNTRRKKKSPKLEGKNELKNGKDKDLIFTAVFQP